MACNSMIRPFTTDDGKRVDMSWWLVCSMKLAEDIRSLASRVPRVFDCIKCDSVCTVQRTMGRRFRMRLWLRVVSPLIMHRLCWRWQEFVHWRTLQIVDLYYYHLQILTSFQHLIRWLTWGGKGIFVAVTYIKSLTRLLLLEMKQKKDLRLKLHYQWNKINVIMFSENRIRS